MINTLAVMAKIIVAAAVLALLAPVRGESYRGYQVFRITPETEQNVVDLMQFLAQSKLDVWREARFPGDAADVMVGPDEAALLKQDLRQRGLNATIMIGDVSKLIEKENWGRADTQQEDSSFHWVGYHTLETIHRWMRQKAELYSHIASVVSAGKATEGREILGLRIAHKPNLPIVFVEAGIHAREWITTATATWFIRQVLSTSDDVLKSYEWHIFPSVNPDGYAFTRKVRLWRKSRGPPNPYGQDYCFGVDLNRNWPYEWQKGENECTNTYPGHAAGSEPETQGLMAYLNSVADRTRVYISLHSYHQLLMYPWGYTKDPPPNESRFKLIAEKAKFRLGQRYNTDYNVGPIATTIYPAWGTTIDYAFSINITYPFVFELRDTGYYGFLLPKEQIIPTAQEALDAVTVILQEAKND